MGRSAFGRLLSTLSLLLLLGCPQTGEDPIDAAMKVPSPDLAAPDLAQVDPDTTQPKVAGGCLRDSYETRGHCAPACTIGPNSCPPDLNSQFRHCVYLDRTMDLMLKPTQDKWKGLLCLPDSASPRKD